MKKTSPKRPALTLAAIAIAVAGCSAPLWASAEQLGWSPQRNVEFVVPMPNPKLRRGQTAIYAEGQTRFFSDVGGAITLASESTPDSRSTASKIEFATGTGASGGIWLMKSSHGLLHRPLLQRAREVICNAVRAEREGYDAFVIGHFQDAGLYGGCAPATRQQEASGSLENAYQARA